MYAYLVILLLMCIGCSTPLPDEVQIAMTSLPDEIDFNYHVRPILSDRCFSCHGPDDDARQGELRLDIEEEAFSSLASGNGKAIVSGSPGRSELIQRILSSDPEIIMPTPESHLTLDNKEKAILYKWIDQGAEWKDHWAFDAPAKSELPEAIDGWTAINEIDHFVHNKIREAGLEPSKEADKERLLRRVTMDLTGLPPTIEEIDAFLADDAIDAYQKVVDRLLASKEAAERLTMEWLDVSRYADSHGLHADGYRLMWPWRDWVIDAFDKNMPYDEFALWQIAGDLLPNATKEQELATAFNRNHTMTAEGGAIDEEFRLAYVFDRTETVATAFQGLTMNCARCHDHKFDPISQKEYYQMNAFFNNVKELGMTGDDGNYGPMLALPSVEQQMKLERIQQSIKEQEEELSMTEQEVIAKADFISSLSDVNVKNKEVLYAPFEHIRERRSSDAKKKRVTDYGEYLNSHIIDNNADITSAALTESVEGKFGKALKFTGEYDEVFLQSVPNFEKNESFSISLWINTTKRDSAKTQMLLCTSGEKNNYWRGWEFDLDGQNRLNVRLIHSLPHNYFHVQSLESVHINQWTHVGFTYDGSEKGGGIKIFINGLPIETITPYDHLYKSIKPIAGVPAADFTKQINTKAFDDMELAYKQIRRPVKVAKSYRAYTGEYGVFKGAIDEIRIFDEELSIAEMAVVSRAVEDNNIDLSTEWQKNHAVNQDYKSNNLKRKLTKARAQKQELIESIPEVMVMSELSQPRPMYIYNRGDYTQPTDEVSAEIPEVLPAFSEELPKNRLGLAKWLFQDDNPLTARVTVNRYWQMIFGKGIVTTPGDFGIQGALPSHPDLLDWLAVDFKENDWDVKRLLRQLVMSSTYRQSSIIRKDDLEIDPENKWLARGSTYRLPAEMIRDNALAASGLLVKETGGASVRPYQPEGLWIEKSFFSKILLNYKQDNGEDLYKRSMYTFIRRTAPPPAMTIFDQPNREVCTIKRENTSTPLQALVLMNDPQFVEASRVLAERIQLEIGQDISSQIQYAFRLATGRSVSKEELVIFEKIYQDQYEIFKKDQQASDGLLNVGETIADRSLDKSQTAALAMVTSTMLNHDEAYMKR